MGIPIKNSHEAEKMRIACRVASQVLERTGALIQPGVSTGEIDRAAAAVYGITVDQVRQELYNCFGSRQVGTIYTASNDYQVILECDKGIQIDPTGLSKIYVKTNTNGAPTAAGAPAAGSGIAGATSPNGPAIPLSAVTKLTPTLGVSNFSFSELAQVSPCSVPIVSGTSRPAHSASPRARTRA